MDRVYQTLARRLRSARERQRLSQEEVADALGLGGVGYGSFERGDRAMSLDYLVRVAPILGVTVPWLLGIETALTDDEDHLLAIYRAADTDLRATLLRAVKAIAGR